MTDQLIDDKNHNNKGGLADLIVAANRIRAIDAAQVKADALAAQAVAAKAAAEKAVAVAEAARANALAEAAAKVEAKAKAKAKAFVANKLSVGSSYDSSSTGGAPVMGAYAGSHGRYSTGEAPVMGAYVGSHGRYSTGEAPVKGAYAGSHGRCSTGEAPVSSSVGGKAPHVFAKPDLPFNRKRKASNGGAINFGASKRPSRHDRRGSMQSSGTSSNESASSAPIASPSDYLQQATQQYLSLMSNPLTSGFGALFDPMAGEAFARNIELLNGPAPGQHDLGFFDVPDPHAFTSQDVINLLKVSHPSEQKEICDFVKSITPS
jgi:hypothetical protein